MDTINSTNLPVPVSTTQKDVVGGQVVTETMRRLNTDEDGRQSPDYAFQTKVLGAQGIGQNVDIWV